MIDSAQGYNETAVGNAVKSSGLDRKEIFIVSKIHPKNLGFEPTIQSIHESLANLQTDYIDLMLIHSKDCDEGPGAHLVCGKGEPKGDWTETWKALEFMVEKGNVIWSLLILWGLLRVQIYRVATARNIAENSCIYIFTPKIFIVPRSHTLNVGQKT